MLVYRIFPLQLLQFFDTILQEYIYIRDHKIIMKTRYELLLIDLDGTLANTLEDLQLSLNLSLKQFNLPQLDLLTVKSYIGQGAKNLIQRSFNTTDTNLIDEYYQIFQKHYRENLLINTRLYKNVLETLNKLNTLNILYTNKPWCFTKKIVPSLGIDNFFKKIVTPETYNIRKPDPLAIYKIADEFKIKKENIIIIGDSIYDIKCGKNANITTCAVNYGYGLKKDLMNADYIINDFSEILNII